MSLFQAAAASVANAFALPPKPERTPTAPGAAWRFLDGALDAVGGSRPLTFMPKRHTGGVLSALDPSKAAPAGRSWSRLP